MEMPTMRNLLEAGLHFGHRTSRWNPKMKKFIYGARNGIHIINLKQSMDLLKKAVDFVKSIVEHGEFVLFVGTKRQAKTIIENEAKKAKMPYVSHRWLGGMLTNYETVKKSIAKLNEVEDSLSIGKVEKLPKKEVLKLEKKRNKLLRNLGGIRDMQGYPKALFIIDPEREKIAILEAKKLGIKVIALTDTNCDPDPIDYIIPGNDDSIRSISLITKVIADACVEGLELRRERLRRVQQEDADFQVSEAAASGEREVKEIGRKRKEVTFKKRGDRHERHERHERKPRESRESKERDKEKVEQNN